MGCRRHPVHLDQERRVTTRPPLAVLMAVLAAAPVSAQRVRLHVGPTFATQHGNWDNTMAGGYGGVSLDVRDNLRTGIFYVQKGSDGFRIHSVEVPMLYKRRITEEAYIVIGPAPSYASYDGTYVDVGAMIGVAWREEDRGIGVEAAFVYGLVPDSHCCSHGIWPGHRVLRAGLEIPLR